MKTFLFFLLVFLSNWFSLTVSGQARGIKPAGDSQAFSGSIRMLVIGVSRYQNIPSLNYAHTDAMAFYNYMISAEGGKVKPANTKLLLNENASATAVYEALDWLVDETKEGETVIFYFAGHGDVEYKTIKQRGFLLATDAPKVAYMACGTVGVSDLQDYLETLTQKNKARVIMITDACHSGKLAGGLEGASNTTAALQQQWENTVKIMSSQPGELSAEGYKWNNGGGVFTYYLVNGLMGLADRNNDKKVTLNELNMYLSDNIPRETNFLQNPIVTGNTSTVISLVDSSALASLKGKTINLSTIDNSELAQRGFEDDIRKKLDTATYRAYTEFKKCLADHRVIRRTKDEQETAKGIYIRLKDNKNAAPVIENMKRSLIAALQNEAQPVFDCWTGKAGVDTFFNEAYDYSCLKIAFEMVDSNYLLYNQIKERYLILDAYDDNGNHEATINNLKKVLELYPDAIYINWLIGECYNWLREPKDALPYLNKAIEIMPGLVPAWWQMGESYKLLKEVEKEEQACLKVISIDSLHPNSYVALGNIYSKRKEFGKAIEYYKKASEVYRMVGLKIPLGRLYIIANLYDSLHISDSAKYYRNLSYEKAKSGNDWEFFADIASTYSDEKKYDEAIKYNLISLEILQNVKPIDNREAIQNICYNLSCVCSLKNSTADALKYLEQSFQSGLKDFKWIKNDPDLDNIRNTPEFKALIKKYKK